MHSHPQQDHKPFKDYHTSFVSNIVPRTVSAMKTILIPYQTFQLIEEAPVLDTDLENSHSISIFHKQ